MLNRRNFLKGAVAGGLGLAVVPSLLAQIPQKSSALCGCNAILSIGNIKIGDVVYIDHETGGLCPAEAGGEYELPIGICTGENEMTISMEIRRGFLS